MKQAKQEVSLAIVLAAAGEPVLRRLLDALALQSDKSFRVYLLQEGDAGSLQTLLDEFAVRLDIRVVAAPSVTPVVSVASAPSGALLPEGDGGSGALVQVLPSLQGESLLWALGDSLTPDRHAVRRLRRCVAAHPDFQVWHMQLMTADGKVERYRLHTRLPRLFKQVFRKGVAAPLGAFVFRTEALRSLFSGEDRPPLSDLCTVFSCARDAGIRTVRWARLSPVPPLAAPAPAVRRQEIESRLAFLHWSEAFFGEDHPLDAGDLIDLYAYELARLYPEVPEPALKERVHALDCVNGPFRRRKAASALKAALKARADALR